MISFSVILFLSLLQTANAVTSENLIQPVDIKVTQFLASRFDCSNQYNWDNSA